MSKTLNNGRFNLEHVCIINSLQIKEIVIFNLLQQFR